MATDKEFLLDWDISLKEKYLSFDKEKRIRRMQFFERILIPWLLLVFIFIYLPSFILGVFYWYTPLFIVPLLPYFFMAFYIVYLLIAFKYYPVIIKKRAQDFWKEWKIETYILLWTILLMTIYRLYTQYLVLNMDSASIIGLIQYTSFIDIIQW